MKNELPDLRTQAELLIVRSMYAVIPRTFDAMLGELPKRQATREQVLGLASRIESIADDAELRLFVLERASPLEAAMIRQSIGLAVHVVRTFPLEHEAFHGICGRLLRGDHLVGLVHLGLVGLAGPDED